MLTVNGRTYPAPKLTPPQISAMWFCAGDYNRSVPAASIRVIVAAGLVDSDRNLTDFGRAWIADQIDQARDEAGNDVRQATDESNQRMRWYRLHHDCTHAYGMAAHVECDHDQALAEEKRDRDAEAEDAQYRAWVDSHGGPTGRFHQQREMVEVDLDEAIDEDRSRRVKAWALAGGTIEGDYGKALAMESVRRGGCGRVILATRVAGPDLCTARRPCAGCARAAEDAKVDPLMAIVDASSTPAAETHRDRLAKLGIRDESIDGDRTLTVEITDEERAASALWMADVRRWEHRQRVVFGDIGTPGLWNAGVDADYSEALALNHDIDCTRPWCNWLTHDAFVARETEFHAGSRDAAAGELADRDDAAMRAAEADAQADEDRQADLRDREAEMAGAYDLPYRTGEDEIEYADESDYADA